MRTLFILFILVCVGCTKDQHKEAPLFSDITTESGIRFSNHLKFTDKLNPYTYRNFYNGAGVAVGDINNDGLLDIYMAGNQVDNKLYLNQGEFKFIDITQKAGVACAGVWSTGVTFVDIDADGFLDIYVCKSGNPDAPNRNNELFINNGDLTFTEKSKEYGLDVTGLSVQAAFFDYDKDGDLDCYLLTNSFRSIGNYDLVKDQRKIPDPQNAGNKFFLNDNGRFRDFSKEANIYRSSIGFGLGITLGDFNDDQWTDIFVSNDFFERDYLYINNQKGAFEESLTSYFESISMGSMGADFADLDNDGNAELFVTEMLPDSLHRRKSKTVFENWNKYQLNVENEYHHQFSRNVLQKKIGHSSYAEIGRYSGVAATEWSWGALIFDMDNDGLKDIFVANGIYKDLLDRDYLVYTGAEENVRKIIKEEKNAIVKLIDLMPSSVFSNYVYHNEGELRFSNKSAAWGLSKPMYSNGSAYGDFDNDGDLDLIINNINAPSAVYKNNTDTSVYKSISIHLTASGKNPFCTGATVTAYVKGIPYMADNFTARGFQSSVQQDITLGLGRGVREVDSVLIEWPDGKYSKAYHVKANKKHVFKREDLQIGDREEKTDDLPTLEKISGNYWKHQGNGLNDFNRDRLLPMMYSQETPSLVKGDINGDGTDELYVGGGKDQRGGFLRMKKGKVDFQTLTFGGDYEMAEETKSELFDADGDGDLDLYVSSGGRFFPPSSSVLNDQLFLNDGRGKFSVSPGALPFKDFVSTSVVKAIDLDNDHDMDLVVARRFDPFTYGVGGGSYLFENDGKGSFKYISSGFPDELRRDGMITDVAIADYNSDGWTDLIVVGDWMPITFLKNNHGKLEHDNSLKLNDTEGWWHSITCADLNGDGKPDFVLGNHGLNSFFKKADRMYVYDFDGNGSVEQIFCIKVGDSYFPIADKDELISQLPSLKKKLLYYKDYAKMTVEEIIDPAILSKAKVLQVNRLASIMLLSGHDGYVMQELPWQAQLSPIYALLAKDVDDDGVIDVIAGGNQYAVKPQFGRQDGSKGWLLKGVINNGSYIFKEPVCLEVPGQIRDIEWIEENNSKYLIFVKHDDDLEVYKVRGGR